MAKFMKMLNNISRSQAIYRQSKISAKDLQRGHYSYVLCICRKPGRSQEEIARDLCVNKSTACRNLNFLEEKGYISRKQSPCDKRQFLVHPTEKMWGLLPEVKTASNEWRTLLSEGIPQSELEVFSSVLQRMEAKAREIIESQEESK